MYLHRIYLNIRCSEARRDLNDPYQMHSTLCRAFSRKDKKCPAGEFLWRLESETAGSDLAVVLVQSLSQPDWESITIKNWLAKADPGIDLLKKLKIKYLKTDQRFCFRLRANPSVTRNKKRLGLLKVEDQKKWIERKGQQHGFNLKKLPSLYNSDLSEEKVDVLISQGQMLRGRTHGGNTISIFSVQYDGILEVFETDKFLNALKSGIGHGKSMGLGLLSVMPIVQEVSVRS